MVWLIVAEFSMGSQAFGREIQSCSEWKNLITLWNFDLRCTRSRKKIRAVQYSDAAGNMNGARQVQIICIVY